MTGSIHLLADVEGRFPAYHTGRNVHRVVRVLAGNVEVVVDITGLRNRVVPFAQQDLCAAIDDCVGCDHHRVVAVAPVVEQRSVDQGRVGQGVAPDGL